MRPGIVPGRLVTESFTGNPNAPPIHHSASPTVASRERRVGIWLSYSAGDPARMAGLTREQFCDARTVTPLGRFRKGENENATFRRRRYSTTKGGFSGFLADSARNRYDGAWRQRTPEYAFPMTTGLLRSPVAQW